MECGACKKYEMEDMFVGVDEEYIPKWYNSKYNGFFIRIKAEE